MRSSPWRVILNQDPLSGHAFLIVSRNRKHCKVLVYDGAGLVIFMKRLETSSQFAALWKHSRGDAIEMTMSELAIFIEGTSLSPSVAFSRTCSIPTSRAPCRFPQPR